MPKKNQQFINASVQDLLHFLEESPQIENILGRFRLTAVLGFLIEMTEVYAIEDTQKQRLIQVRDELANGPIEPMLEGLN